MTRHVKTFDEFLDEARTRKQTFPNRYPFNTLVKTSIKSKGFQIIDGDEMMGGAIVTGKMKSGTMKGRYAAYMVSFDMGMDMRHKDSWASEEEALAALAWANGPVQYDTLFDKGFKTNR